MAKISNQDIANSIYQTLQDKTGSAYSLALKNIVNFLARRRLFSQAAEILNRLQRIVDQEKGAVRVKVSGAKSLGTHLRHDLVKILERRYKAKEIIFNEEVDEKLISGFKFEIGDEVIDLTMKNRIKKLAEHLQ